MNQVYQSAFLKALGWSLIDSLWQMGLMWLLYLVLTANGKRFQSHQRHTLALLSLAGGSVWFLVSLVVNFYEAAVPSVVTLSEAMAATASGSLFAQLSLYIESALPFLSILYLLAAAWLFIRFYYRYYHTRQLLKAHTIKADPELRVFLQQAAARMGIKKKVAIWLSVAAEAPMTLGFWKPVILLPVAIVNHLSLQQTEAIILHELKHIKRNDYLINILMACAEAVLFFNPFAQWLSNAIRRERENSCDDLVLQFRYDPAQYATSLLVLEQQRSASKSNFGVAATGSKTPALLHRVQRILQQKQISAPVSQRMIAYLFTAIVIGFIGFANPGELIVKKFYPVVVNYELSPAMVSYVVNEKTATPKQIAPKEAKATCKPVNTAIAQAEAFADAQEATRAIVSLTANDTEQLLQLANTIRLAHMIEQYKALVQEQQAAAQNNQLVIQVSTGEARDFTLTTREPLLCTPDQSPEIKPYVPRSSFTYQYMQDSATPKIQLALKLQAEAKLAMERAMNALNEVDWQKLEAELRACDIALSSSQIREELQKAYMELTWKRIAEGVQATAEQTKEAYAKAQAVWQQKLQAYQKARQKKRAEHDALRKQIVEERLMENLKPEQRKAVQATKVIDI